jgi:hypothetical protein
MPCPSLACPKSSRNIDLERVIVNAAVQEKAIAHLLDSRLLEIARHKFVSAVKHVRIELKQTTAKVSKTLRRNNYLRGCPFSSFLPFLVFLFLFSFSCYNPNKNN